MYKILLDVGHSKRQVGCLSQNSLWDEHYFNYLQASILQEELKLNRITSHIVDLDKDDRKRIGAMARGYDMFISIRLNAYDKKEHYSCCKVDSKYNNLDSINFASKVAHAMAQALGLPAAKGNLIAGVISDKRVEVLTAASKTGCPIYFLTEAFFLDAHADKLEIERMCEKAMLALAKTVMEVVYVHN